jgi:hypothetical protein
MMASREEEEGVGGYDMRDWIEGVWRAWLRKDMLDVK